MHEWLNATELWQSLRSAIAKVVEYLWKIFKSGKSKMNNSQERRSSQASAFLASSSSIESRRRESWCETTVVPTTNVHAFQYISVPQSKTQLSSLIHSYTSSTSYSLECFAIHAYTSIMRILLRYTESNIISSLPQNHGIAAIVPRGFDITVLHFFVL